MLQIVKGGNMNGQMSLFNDEKKEKITSKVINELIGIKESFELPDKLMTLLLNEEEKTNYLIIL